MYMQIYAEDSYFNYMKSARVLDLLTFLQNNNTSYKFLDSFVIEFSLIKSRLIVKFIISKHPYF